MRAFAICRINEGGGADVDKEVTPYDTYVIAAQYGHVWGLYLFAGTAKQLAAINAAPNVIGMCSLANVNTVVSPAFRAQVNPWLAANGYTTIPAGWTYQQVIDAICKRLRPDFDMDNKLYIVDSE